MDDSQAAVVDCRQQVMAWTKISPFCSATVRWTRWSQCALELSLRRSWRGLWILAESSLEPTQEWCTILALRLVGSHSASHSWGLIAKKVRAEMNGVKVLYVAWQALSLDRGSSEFPLAAAGNGFLFLWRSLLHRGLPYVTYTTAF